MRLKQTQPEKDSGSPGPINKWIVPFERNCRVTDRESELTRLQNMLFTSNQFAKVAVSGLGGVGKTQLALELLYRLKEKHGNYTAIWIHVTSMESLDQGYHAIAQQLGIKYSRSKEADVKQHVQEYLSEDSAGHWIIVYDNADDIDMWTDKSNRLIDYISRSKNGRVIFTTRNKRVGVKLAYQNVMELSQLSEDSAVRMLRNLLIQKDIVDSNLADAKTMAAWLCHLPLAIAQAPSSQEQDIIESLSEEFEDDARYYGMKNPVTTTWLISFRAVARLEEVFPDHGHRNRAVWRTYLPHARYVLESALVAKDNASRIDLEWKLALCYYSDGRFDEAETFFREVLEFRTSMLGPRHPDTLESMAKLALAYHAQSRFQESKALGVKAMETQKIVLGEEDPETMSTMSNLAMTYSDLSQWKEAESLELETMKLRMRILGEEHPQTLVGMSNLVYLYNCQGWWERAEELGKRTTSARKKILGDEHPETLLRIGNLAHTYNNQGRYKEAEDLLTHVVNVRVRTLGKEHPHTLSGMSNLAVSYHNQDRWDEAEGLQTRVVAARQTLLGPEHFSTLTSMAHLSSTYHRQGRWAEAEKLCIQTMELRKKILGPEHHHTLTSMTNLASIYLDDGQLSRAEELGLEVLATRERVLGMEHTHSLASMEHLAATYKKQARIAEAEDLEIQVAELQNATVL
ncbi:TPR-like protein [Penicillium hetheringtonii]|uniref:TPR-like protein n=1 Tax=Penicillium hetheringtonii TaxID=911720 RepID=A0AAD6H0P7_9EURO|nr:TPR-like protein [Penicillium hetheringtonii]